MDKIKDGKVFIWMQLLGFERNDDDRGASRFLNQTGFTPDGACALLFHPDFVHQHRGMEQEYELPADICAYYGIPGNIERKRQPWTNHDLKNLSDNLTAEGSGLYAGIMGSAIGNTFHREWVCDHPEVQTHGRDGVRGGHFILKRFSDGTYYEDFFIDKVCEMLKDYGFKGIHLADGLCPNGNIFHGDYSTDLVTQFTDSTGFVLPKEVTTALGCDEAEIENMRGDWIWKNAREEWIEFLCGRWEGFFKKLCSRVHAIGREVMILGMYCTDPFETKYCLGMDLARVMDAGVDYLTANILPTSCYLSNPWESQEYFFHRYMCIAPTTAAHIRSGHLVSMVGLQDASEEWDAMKHAPCLHQRDIYTMMAYQTVGENGTQRALEGYFLCLGDGIQREAWDWERKRMEIAMSANVKQTLSAAMLWSDTAYEKMLCEYIRTRRWTPFKLLYELAKAGVHCGTCIRSEAISGYSGTLLAPDFDLLSPEEQELIKSYNRGAVICTASPEFDLKANGIKADAAFSDRFSSYPLKVFALGAGTELIHMDEIEALLSTDDGAENIDPAEVVDYDYTLVDTLKFAKVTSGFFKAVAKLVMTFGGAPLSCDKPFMAFLLENGAYRIYLFNDNDYHYRRAFVSMQVQVEEVKIISDFPILPVRFVDEASGLLTYRYTDENVPKERFEVKLQPGGATIIDVYPKV